MVHQVAPDLIRRVRQTIGHRLRLRVEQYLRGSDCRSAAEDHLALVSLSFPGVGIDHADAGLQLLQEDLQKNLRSALEAGLSHLELVTREEFEIQRAVLLRTREKLEGLERRIAELEADTRPSAD